MYQIAVRTPEYDITEIQPPAPGHPFRKSADLEKWAAEISSFSGRLDTLSEKAKILADLFSEASVLIDPMEGLRQMKGDLFSINDSLNQALRIADRIETALVHPSRH